MSEIENLRTHFYGVQGSGSIFPAKAERMETQEFSDLNLLTHVFQDIRLHAGADNKLDTSAEDILGGSIDRQTLAQYRQNFSL